MFQAVTRVELHHFSDASQEYCYGAVSYLRLVSDDGQVHCAFVMGKSRVKPLGSTMTVPKLETAATLLTQMNSMIIRELEGRMKINDVTYWTDSTIVLRYILNTRRRFVTFVANRVALIHQSSNPKQWRHVRSEDNPADYASRGLKPSESDKLDVWRNGPDFLWKNSKEWPKQPEGILKKLSDEDEGVKKEKNVGLSTASRDFWEDLFPRYSTWTKLVRSVAWLVHGAKRFSAS